jgi:hypothetical protein
MARLIAITTAALAALTFTGSSAQAQAHTQPDRAQPVFSGDAYDNEMGIHARPRANGIIAVLIG